MIDFIILVHLEILFVVVEVALFVSDEFAYLLSSTLHKKMFILMFFFTSISTSNVSFSSYTMCVTKAINI